MKVSVNTAVFLHDIKNGKSQSECLQDLVMLPIDNIEVRGELFDEATGAKELEQIKVLCNNNAWGFFYSIPEQLFQIDQVNPNLSIYLQMANKYHIKQFKISKGDLTKITDQQLKELKALLEQYEVTVTIENEPNENGTIEAFQKDLTKIHQAKIPVGYTFDSGNWYWIYETPTLALTSLVDQISVFHLKDIKNKQTVMLDNGATDWRNLVKKIATDVPIFLEYDIPSQNLLHQIELVNSVIDDSVVEL